MISDPFSSSLDLKKNDNVLLPAWCSVWCQHDVRHAVLCENLKSLFENLKYFGKVHQLFVFFKDRPVFLKPRCPVLCFLLQRVRSPSNFSPLKSQMAVPQFCCQPDIFRAHANRVPIQLHYMRLFGLSMLYNRLVGIPSRIFFAGHFFCALLGQLQDFFRYPIWLSEDPKKGGLRKEGGLHTKVWREEFYDGIYFSKINIPYSASLCFFDCISPLLALNFNF